MNRVDSAIVFASKAHDGQRRKVSEVPYIVHPVCALKNLILNQVYDEDVLVATVLHDVMEDTVFSYSDIEDAFGESIADLCMTVTEDKSKSWEERKRHTINELKYADIKTKYILLADKHDNLRSMVSEYELHKNSLWLNFKRGEEYQKWYYYHVIKVLNDDERIRNMNMFRECIEYYEALFGKITETTFDELKEII
jgi:(p)ppGpp synthase/HD superfamily hydrolase